MFKSVEYAGFEDNPELQQAVERVTPVIANILRDWAKNVAVEWLAYPDNPVAAELTLRLELPTAEGSGSLFLSVEELTNPMKFEERCRSVWLRSLDEYFERRKPAWDEIINQPAEV